MTIYSYFKHPNSVCMSYYRHLSSSLYYSRRMFFASIKALIHAFFPSLFITSTTNTVDDIHELLKINNCKNK